MDGKRLRLVLKMWVLALDEGEWNPDDGSSFSEKVLAYGKAAKLTEAEVGELEGMTLAGIRKALVA
jgi:hypothetical protein